MLLAIVIFNDAMCITKNVSNEEHFIKFPDASAHK